MEGFLMDLLDSADRPVLTQQISEMDLFETLGGD